MTPHLSALHAYPFQKLRDLFADVCANPAYSPINLSIGEPKHATPACIQQAVVDNLAGLAGYPATQGSDALRIGIANWLKQRFHLQTLDANTQVLPVNGSREALFAFAQTVINSQQPDPIVIAPNPFYQIYEGAALLAGATPYYVNALVEHQFKPQWHTVPVDIWQRCQLLYVCSPNNPTGTVMALEEWAYLFNLADEYDFVIASDECYSEIYPDEEHPPLGALQAAQALGRTDYARLVVFGSLSKRSNVPGMRSGFVAGNAALIQAFLLYRTYHGCAMSPVIQAASLVAWQDEAHVLENRAQYRAKFTAVLRQLQPTFAVSAPDAAFYLWLPTPCEDTEFAKALYRDYQVTVLPGSYLARTVQGINPGAGFVRMALVAPLAECIAAAERIVLCSKNFVLTPSKEIA